MISYVLNEYNQKWDLQKAQIYLTKFLMADDNTHSIFVNSDINNIYEKNSDEWIIKSYVQHIKEEQDIYYNFLLDIIKGLAIYIGTLYTDPDEKTLNIDNTDFYLDTKLILRYLGYTTETYKQSIQQLVDIIRDIYGGNICVFKHTVKEVEVALYKAYESLKNSQDIDDNELRLYSHLKCIDGDDFKVFSDSVESDLMREKIRIQEKIEWEDTSCWINSINEALLFEEIKKYRKTYKKKSIDNDVAAMNQINMLRGGDYSVHFGGENRLPIIVTNNTFLIKNVKDFILKDLEEDDHSGWKIGKMPIISDTSLMCKLWNKSKDKILNVPELLFSKNAYSILAYDDTFFENLKERSVQLKEKYRLKVFSLPNERIEKIEKIIIKNNGGDIETLSDDELYSTIEESYKIEKMTLEETVQSQNEIIEEKNNIITNKDKQLVTAYSQKYINKLGFNIILIWFGKYWWALSTAIFAFISYWAFPKLNTTNNIPLLIRIIFLILPIFAVIILELMKKYTEKKENAIEAWCIKKACDNYKQRTTRKLSAEEQNFKQEILDYCIEQTKYFKNKKDT